MQMTFQSYIYKCQTSPCYILHSCKITQPSFLSNYTVNSPAEFEPRQQTKITTSQH